jgi:UDP-galactopyranose mutase
MKDSIYIIGAGPTGLGVAYASRNDIVILEKSDAIGGLCRSYDIEGAVFDIGGHSFHTPHPDVREIITDKAGLKLYTQERHAWVYHDNELIPYPFQKNYEQLSNLLIKEDCANTAGNKLQADSATNFEDWVNLRFGNGIAKHFMLPYNRKLWARDLRRIATDWVIERVAAPKEEKQSFSEISGKRMPLQSDTMVSYPAEGGFGEIFKKIAEHIKDPIKTNTEVKRISVKEHTITFDKDTPTKWETIISTMPLPTLARIIPEFPENISKSLLGLEAMSLYVVYLVLDEKLHSDVQRIYSAEEWFPAHKVAINHNSSLSLRQRTRQAIMAEVSYSKDKPVEQNGLASKIIEGLCKMGLIGNPNKVIHRWIDTIPYAYPVYTHDRPIIVQAAKEWLEQHGIYSAGRFGSWEYKNSDACLKEGIELAARLSL